MSAKPRCKNCKHPGFTKRRVTASKPSCGCACHRKAAEKVEDDQG